MNIRMKQMISILVIALVTVLPQSVFADTGVWSSSGPSNINVDGLSISPDFVNDETIFAATYGNYVYKSIDSGQTWNQMTNGLASSNVNCVAVFPNFSSNSANKTVFAGTDNGVYVSTNGGSNWSLSGLSGKKVLSLATASDKTVFAGTYENGIYSLSNGSTDWQRLDQNADLNTARVSAIAISPHYSSDETVFAATDGKGVFISNDKGQTWKAINDGISDFSIKALAIDPTYNTTGTVFAGSYETANSGQPWTDSNPLGNIVSLAISPDFGTDRTIYAATDGSGVFKSADGGISWNPFNSGLTNFRALALAISPGFGQDGLLFAGTGGGGIFVCPTKGDTRAPTVVSTDPSGGAKNVSVNKNIVITFSEDIVAGPDNFYSQISLKDQSGNSSTLGTGNKTISGRVLTINPSNDLAYNSTYTLTIPNGAIRDKAGLSLPSTLTLTFSTPSNIVPSVSSSDPSNNENNVSKSKTIKITFGDNIYSNSNYDNIKLKNPNNGEIKITKEISNKVLTIDPIVELERSGQYTVTVPANAVKYGNGNSLAADYILYFNVSSGVSGPVVIGTTPADNTTDISKTSDISVVFDVDIQTSTYYSDIAVKDPNGNKIASALSISSKTLTINPSNDLISGASYTVTIPSSSVKDTSSKSMSYQYKFTFRVLKDSGSPAAPQNLNTSSISGNTIRLSWNNNQESDLAGYNIYRKKKDTGGYGKLNSSLVTSTQYDDNTVQAGQTYIYYVTAVDRSDNESGRSSEVEAVATNVLAEIIFSDVTSGTWYASYVNRLLSLKILNGYPNGTFQPTKNITRAEFAKAIVLTMGWSTVNPSSPSFQDVARSDWAYAYIETARSKGIINGYTDNTFKAGNNISRAEMTQMVMLALQLAGDSTSYPDTSSHWARNYIGACIKAGIVSGYTDGVFRPDNFATRAEAAKILVKTLDKK